MKTATKPQPFLCTVEQARAFANGATQFRVPVQPQPTDETQAMRDVPGENRWWAATATCDELGTEYRPLGSDQQHEWHCPYPPGTVLAVKEPWSDCRGCDGPPAAYRASGDVPSTRGWRSARTMPTWAVRTHLEVVSVRVQQVHDMHEADATAELAASRITRDCKLLRFITYWNDTHGSRPGFDWDSNPWVWVFEVKRVKIGGGR